MPKLLQKIYILSDKIVKLSLTYAKTKSFPLTRTDKTYQIQKVALLVPLLQFSTKRQQIAEKGEVPCHTNASQNSKPCFRTSKDVLYKAKEKYECGWVKGQSRIWRDKQKIRWNILFVFKKWWTRRHSENNRQKEKAKKSKRKSTPEFSGEFSTRIMLQC